MTLKDIGAKLTALPGEIAAAIGKLQTTADTGSVTAAFIAEIRTSFTTLSATVDGLKTALTACEASNTALTADNAKLTSDLAAANAKIANPKGEIAAKAAELAANQGIPAIAATGEVSAEKTQAEMITEYRNLIAQGKSKEAGEMYSKIFPK